MNTYTPKVNDHVVFAGNGSTGRVGAIYTGGLCAEFVADNGPRFTVRADELYPVASRAQARRVSAQVAAKPQRPCPPGGRIVFKLERPHSRRPKSEGRAA